jgi:hypothetical protein
MAAKSHVAVANAAPLNCGPVGVSLASVHAPVPIVTASAAILNVLGQFM